MSYLIDTNVISELRKRSPDRSVLAWFDAVLSPEIFLSVLTIGEIRLGIERLRARMSPKPLCWSSGYAVSTPPIEIA